MTYTFLTRISKMGIQSFPKRSWPLEDCLAFEELLKITRQLVIGKEKKDALLRSLIYFKEQSLSAEARRDSNEDLCAAFRKFETLAVQNQVAEHFVKTRAWLKAQKFCGVPAKVAAAAPEIAKQKELSPETFFRALLSKVHALKFKDSNERWLLYLGVRALLLESELPKPRREQTALLPIWKSIWPLLKKYALLKEIEENKVFKDQMTFFLKGNFGTEPDQFRKRGTPLRGD